MFRNFFPFFIIKILFLNFIFAIRLFLAYLLSSKNNILASLLILYCLFLLITDNPFVEPKTKITTMNIPPLVNLNNNEKTKYTKTELKNKLDTYQAASISQNTHRDIQLNLILLRFYLGQETNLEATIKNIEILDPNNSIFKSEH